MTTLYRVLNQLLDIGLGTAGGLYLGLVIDLPLYLILVVVWIGLRSIVAVVEVRNS